MDGVKALVVLASIYYPGDGIVAKNKYQTSSGQRYDQTAPKCAALKWPLGTMLHLVHGRNNIDVTINDHGPHRKGRALDCTPAVDKALHLGGLGSVGVEPYPPLPKARPVEAQNGLQCISRSCRSYCGKLDLFDQGQGSFLPSVIKLPQRELGVKLTVIQACNAHGTSN